jgi:predicted AlkP superfamily phosphohydrolase/phosphomutase
MIKKAQASSRVAIVGIDGFSPLYMDRFLSQGKLPAISAIVREGAQVPLVSTLPATTPVAWATIATGAPPSSTGIEGFLIHRPGDRLDQRVSGCYSYRCRAQSIWETASLAGKRSYVIKFPLSYPSSTATFRLDGAAGWGGLKCFHEAVSSAVASTDPLNQEIRIQPYSATWLSEDSRDMQALFRGVCRFPTLWGEENVTLHVALTKSSAGEVAVDIADAPDRNRILVTLKQGEWSSPITIRAPGRRGVADFCFRIKVLTCTASPPGIRLFNTAMHERTGHTEPDELWQRYVDLVGPIEEQTEPSLVFKAGLDISTQLEVFRLNSEWLQRISRQIITHEPWDLFMVHIHIVDWAHHLLHGAIDPRHPDYDLATAPLYEQALLDSYRMADDLVGAVADAIGTDVNIIVLGDHGQDLQHTTFRTNEWLAKEGFLTWAGNGTEVDWSSTRAYATGNYIHLNQRDREPTGIIPPPEVERAREEIVEKLLNLTDPLNGSRPILIAGDKREFEYLGANGAGVGDIVFCLRSGYQATNDRGEILTRTRVLQEFTSGHDHFWPLDPRIHTRLFAAGPSFKRSYRHKRLASLIDVAPTVAAALGIDSPAECQGHAIQELFADHCVEPLQIDSDSASLALGL